MMLAKRKRVTPTLPPKKRKKSTSTIAEISFDLSAREDYLTGFHKRKLQRTKRAQEEAKVREREEKIVARKTLREGRKADLERHVEEINALLSKAEGGVSDSDEDEGDEGQDEWEGIAAEELEQEAEYEDEDRHTTVTIESVHVTRDGLQKVVEDQDDEEVVEKKEDTDVAKNTDGAVQGTGKRVWTKERPGGPKKKKPKFRYESKAERKVTRYKERSGNKAKAKARSDVPEVRTGGGKAQAMARKKK